MPLLRVSCWERISVMFMDWQEVFLILYSFGGSPAQDPSANLQSPSGQRMAVQQCPSGSPAEWGPPRWPRMKCVSQNTWALNAACFFPHSSVKSKFEAPQELFLNVLASLLQPRCCSSHCTTSSNNRMTCAPRLHTHSRPLARLHRCYRCHSSFLWSQGVF